MDWNSESRDGALIVRPGGPVDHENADSFDRKLMAALGRAAGDGSRLVIDFGAVDYMSSVGLRVLAKASKEAREHRVTIAIVGLRGIMVEIFQIARFDRLFPVFDTVADALAAESD